MLKKTISPVLIMVLAVLLCGELAARHFMPLLEDRSGMAIKFKRDIIKGGGRRDDVVLLGSSQVMAFDARAIEMRFPPLKVYNYAVPNMNTTLQYFLELKMLLEHSAPHRPKLLVFSIPYFAFYDKSLVLLYYPSDYRFRGMFERDFVDRSLPDLMRRLPGTLDEIYDQPAKSVFASFRIIPFVKEFYSRGAFTDRASMRQWFNDRRRLLRRLRKSNGQLLFNARSRMRSAKVLAYFSANENSLKVLDRIVEDIKRMVDYAAGQGVPVVFINMPISSIFVDELKKAGLFEPLREKLRMLERLCPNFMFKEIEEFYDWSLRRFGDHAFHLNDDGAAALNDVFLNRYWPEILDMAGIECERAVRKG